eukprot:c18604_g1_i1 orf=71-268(+)
MFFLLFKRGWVICRQAARMQLTTDVSLTLLSLEVVTQMPLLKSTTLHCASHTLSCSRGFDLPFLV